MTSSRADVPNDDEIQRQDSFSNSDGAETNAEETDDESIENFMNLVETIVEMSQPSYIETITNDFWLSKLGVDDYDIVLENFWGVYCANQSMPRLQTGHSLGQLLSNGMNALDNDHFQDNSATIDPFQIKDGEISPIGTLFSTCYWDSLLETFYSPRKVPSLFVKARFYGFLDENREYYQNPLEDCLSERFAKFARCMIQYGLRMVNEINWYDVPPMLRIIGTKHATICEGENDWKVSYFQNSLRGLSPRILMLPFTKYDLNNNNRSIFNAELVSSTTLFMYPKRLCLIFSTHYMFLLVSRICLAWNLDI